MTINGFELSQPVMNAACSLAKSMEDLDAMLATKAGAALIGSITWPQRDGNPEPRWLSGEGLGFALNSFGMPNNGHEWYEENGPEMVKRSHAVDKPLFLSVAGFSVEEYVELAELAEKCGFDVVELNLGCPNTSEANRPNPIFSFDLETMERVLQGVEGVLKKTLYTVKLSPYSNPAELERVAKMIGKSNALGVVASNTFPNGYWQDETGAPVIAANKGLAGTSGEAMLPISLGQVKQFREHLPDTKIVIGVGGASTPEHVQQYQNAGAAIVQVATHIVRHGHAAINDLIAA